MCVNATEPFFAGDFPGSDQVRCKIVCLLLFSLSKHLWIWKSSPHEFNTWTISFDFVGRTRTYPITGYPSFFPVKESTRWKSRRPTGCFRSNYPLRKWDRETFQETRASLATRLYLRRTLRLDLIRESNENRHFELKKKKTFGAARPLDWNSVSVLTRIFFEFPAARKRKRHGGE